MVTRLDLGEANEKFIRDEVESGNYASDSEVIRDALQQLQEKKQMEQLRELIAVGDRQIGNGEVTPYSPEMLKQITQQAIQNAKSGLPIKDEVKP